MTRLSEQEFAKFTCAYRAALMVENGMKLGLGTGSTAAWLIRILAHFKKTRNLTFKAVSTSKSTMRHAQKLGIELSTLDELGKLDLTIDGADEFDSQLNLIKGGGAALLQEKIVATSSHRMIVISDSLKRVRQLGAFPLPVEIVKFGHRTTAYHIFEQLDILGYANVKVALRIADGFPIITDEGHHIYDLHLNTIHNVRALSDALLNIAGIVETGLFIDIADMVVIGTASGDSSLLTRYGVKIGEMPSFDDLNIILNEIQENDRV